MPNAEDGYGRAVVGRFWPTMFLLQCMSLLMALNRCADRAAKCPLSGAKRKKLVLSECDPKLTSASFGSPGVLPLRAISLGPNLDLGPAVLTTLILAAIPALPVTSTLKQPAVAQAAKFPPCAHDVLRQIVQAFFIQARIAGPESRSQRGVGRPSRISARSICSVAASMSPPRACTVSAPLRRFPPPWRRHESTGACADPRQCARSRVGCRGE
jgi:hypothetical protein